jgi:GNAT superfamily N-acetyltransferase
MAFLMTQTEIDRRTYNLTPGPFAQADTCMVCAAAPVTHVSTPEPARGRLFLIGPREAAFEPARCIAVCDGCWPKWLMWRAKMGFDLHTHHPASECAPDCLARRGGRRTQVASQMSLLQNRTDGFFLVKAIDGAPRVNGSHLIMAQRTANFTYRLLNRQFYYELLPDAEHAQRLLLASAGWCDTLAISRAYIDRVQIVVEAFESWYSAPKGAITMPAPGDRSIGLHAVLLTHYSESGETLGFVNSWGPGWGNCGYGTMPFEYIKRYYFDALVTRRARWGPMSWTFYGAKENSPRELRRRLLIENPRRRGKLRVGVGENWQTCVYETLSPAHDTPVTCVEIANGFGLKMGWAFLRLLRTGSTEVVEIPELFVWPTFRRMGIGRLLDEFAVGHARLWDCSELRLMMNEADAVVGSPRAAARLFAQSVGYKWKWHQDVAPRRPATAFKMI